MTEKIEMKYYSNERRATFPMMINFYHPDEEKTKILNKVKETVIKFRFFDIDGVEFDKQKVKVYITSSGCHYCCPTVISEGEYSKINKITLSPSRLKFMLKSISIYLAVSVRDRNNIYYSYSEIDDKENFKVVKG